MVKRIFGISVNKFFAIGFAGLAITLLLTEMIMSIVVLGAASTFTFASVINYILLFAAFGVLLWMNIRNDDRAYLGITLLVFYIGFDGFYGIYDSFTGAIYFLSNGAVTLGLAYLLSIVFWMGQLAMGVLTYIWIFRYRFGRTNNFKLLFLFATLFVLAIVLTTAVSLWLQLLANPLWSLVYIVIFLCFYLSQIAAGISILFTLKRLRRL